MYLPQNDISEIVLRQRNQKQELFKALTKNQTKLDTVQQEMRFLNQPLNTDYVDECERLDDEIDKLRRVCQAMLNEIEHLKRARDTQLEQRLPVRPAPPPPPIRPPRTRPVYLVSRQPLNPSVSVRSVEGPVGPPVQITPTSLSQQETFQQPQPKVMDTDPICDPSRGEQPWQCNMCTFQNHPLLNKCECCDNVRIIPGSVRIVPSRPPPPVPLAALGSRSAPQTPATPVTLFSGPASACVQSQPNEFSHPRVANSSSEGNMPQFLGDVVI